MWDSFVSLIGTLFVCLICLSPLFVILWIIYSSQKEKAKNPQNVSQPNSAEFLAFLKEQKAQGYTNIDDLIAKFEPQPIIQEQEEPKEKPIELEIPLPSWKYKDTIDKPFPKDPSQKLSFIDKANASVLLYLGAFLVVFATFVLVAFNWENYSNILKSCILIITLLAFYGAGIGFYKVERFKQAGLTFMLIASISFGLVGLGLWNFLVKDSTNFSFTEYWLIFSLLTAIVYAITFYYLKTKILLYFLIFTIYSIFFSLAFSITTDGKFRIVILALLNFGFYLYDFIFKENKNVVRISTRIMNQVFNVLIILTIGNYLREIRNLDTQLIAFAALLIPTIFELLVFYKQRSNIEAIISILISPLKLLLIINIFKILPNYGVIAFVVFLILLASLVEFIYRYKPNWNKICLALKSVIWFVAIALTYVLALKWAKLNFVELTRLTQLFSLIGIGLALFIPEILRKRILILSILQPYLIFAVADALAIIKPNSGPKSFSLLFIGLVALSFFSLFAAHKLKRPNLLKIITSFSFLSVLISTLLSFNTQDWRYITLSSAASFVVFIGLSYFYKISLIRILSIPFALITTFGVINLVNEYIFTLTRPDISLIILIPAIVYGYLYDYLEFAKKKFIPELLGLITFGGTAIICSVGNISTLAIVIGILSAYSIYAIFRFKSYSSAIATFFLTSAFILCLHINFKFDVNLAIFLFSALFLFFSLTNLIEYVSVKAAKAFNYLAVFASIIFALFLIPIALESYGVINFLFIFACIFLSLGLFVQRIELIKFISPLPLLAGFWYIFHILRLNADLYFLPIAIYVFGLGIYFYYASGRISFNEGKLVFNKVTDTNKYALAHVLEIIAYSLEMLLLLFQSMLYPNSGTKIFYGFVLIFFAISILIRGQLRKNTILIVFAIIFIFLELLIRLYVLILMIPWWIYLGLIGLGLIALAVYILSKVERK